MDKWKFVLFSFFGEYLKMFTIKHHVKNKIKIIYINKEAQVA